MEDPDGVVYGQGHILNTVKNLHPGEHNALSSPGMPHILLKSPKCWTIH